MKSSILSRILLCLGLTCVLAGAQETVESVRRQIKAVEAETAREKNLHDAEKKRHAEFVEVGRKKVQALSSQTKTINSEIDSLKSELKHISDARQKTMGTIKWFEGRKARYNESLAKVIDSLAPVFESDFPYRNEETVKSVAEIADQLHKGVIEADDALNRTKSFMTASVSVIRPKSGRDSCRWTPVACPGRSCAMVPSRPFS